MVSAPLESSHVLVRALHFISPPHGRCALHLQRRMTCDALAGACGAANRATIVLEHVLFVAKTFIVNILPEDVPNAKLSWQIAEGKKKKQLDRWGIVENEVEDPTP